MCCIRTFRLLLVVALVAVPCGVSAQTPLDDLVREGLRSNLALRQERLLQDRAEAGVREANARYLPSLAFDARYSESRGGLDLGELVNPAHRTLNQLTGTNAFPTNVSARLPFAQETKLRLTQPLYNGALSGNQEIARGLRDLQGATRDAAARRLAADIQLAYLAYAGATRIAELYAATLNLVDENVRVNEALLASGSITADAVHRARAERGEVRQRLADAERRRGTAGERVNFLLARELDAPLPLIADSLLTRETAPSLGDALAHARLHREELRQVESTRRVARGQERIARASQLPSIAVAFDYGVQGARYQFTPDHDVFVASVVVQWNLFDGGQDGARRQQARLESSRAVLRREESERQIALQVRESFAAMHVAGVAITTADDRLISARRTFSLVSRRYEEGMAPLIEYLDARTTLTEAELNRILTFYDYVARQVELEHAAALRPIEP
jgi:outer membrane protein TolC